jgi:acetyl-CoA carboxylase carboxyl transferase subunit alpha
VADRLIMLEHSIYSVASPEGTAAILWRDSAKAPDAARAMKITAQDLLALEVIDAIVPEPEGGAHTNAEAIIAAAGDVIRSQLVELLQLDILTLLDHRYAKYRAIGRYQERQSQVIGHTNGDGDGGASLLLPFT